MHQLLWMASDLLQEAPEGEAQLLEIRPKRLLPWPGIAFGSSWNSTSIGRQYCQRGKLLYLQSSYCLFPMFNVCLHSISCRRYKQRLAHLPHVFVHSCLVQLHHFFSISYSHLPMTYCIQHQQYSFQEINTANCITCLYVLWIGGSGGPKRQYRGNEESFVVGMHYWRVWIGLTYNGKLPWILCVDAAENDSDVKREEASGCNLDEESIDRENDLVIMDETDWDDDSWSNSKRQDDKKEGRTKRYAGGYLFGCVGDASTRSEWEEMKTTGQVGWYQQQRAQLRHQ